jgi:hypothetical protein
MSSIAAGLRGEIPFPQAGEGVTLRFTNSIMLTLQDKLGADFVSEAYPRVAKHDLMFIATCVNMAIHKDGKPAALRFADLDHIPIEDIESIVLDGIFLAVFGRTFEGQLEYARVMAARGGADAPPPVTPET